MLERLRRTFFELNMSEFVQYGYQNAKYTFRRRVG